MVRSPRPAPRLGRARVGLTTAVAALALAAAPVGTGRADATDTAGERVDVFAASVMLEPDGQVVVTERITYDFGTEQRHGIFRFLPDRIPCRGASIGPSCPEGRDRILRFDVRGVSVDGGPVTVEQRREGASTVLRIGDPDRTVAGRHTYVLTYHVLGALDPTGDGGAVLAWNVVGSGWKVDMGEVTVEPVGPVTLTSAACRFGPPASVASCGPTPPWRVAPLPAGQDVTITLVAAPETVASTAPILQRHRTYLGPFLLDPRAYALGVVAALAGAGAVWRIGRRGRDRRFAGGDVEVAMGRAGQPEETKPVFADLPEVIEFAPPAGIRPGLLGALVDEQVDARDVSATIVDLAARGYLRLTQLPKDDWRIARGDRAPDADLAPYEALLVSKLVGEREAVELSALKQKWSAHHRAVCDAIYDSLVTAGWYRGRPDRARARAIGKGVALVLVGLAVVLLARRTVWALAGAPLVVAGIAACVVSRYAGQRTATGTAMAARCRGFRRLVETPTQQEMARVAERRDVFVEYLPYAVVFGCASRWAKRFAALGAVAPATPGWYVPLPRDGGGSSADPWDDIAAAVADFAGSAASSLPASAASSGSGSGGAASSGGGFGGGGGGSW